MPNLETEDKLRPVVRTSQIITAALIAGPSVFLVIAVLMGPTVTAKAAPAPGPGATDDPLPLIFNGLAIAGGAMAILMSFVLPPQVAANGRKDVARRTLAQNAARGPEKAGKLQPIEDIQTGLLPLFTTQHIVGGAILEGGAFLAAVATMLVGGPIAPAVAVVLLIVLIARFPTEPRVQLWLDQQREKLRDEEFAATASR